MIDKHIEQYGKRLYGLCVTLCAASRGSAEADDLYQETWLKAVKHYSQYDATREFEPWLTKICVNTYRSTLRRIVRSPFFNAFSSNEEKDAVIRSVAAAPPLDYSPLHQAVNELPLKLRLTLILFYFQDRDLKSTAEALGIPIGTVKSRLNKSKKLLKEALKNETDIPF